jgi:hypothetical protein
MSSSDAPKPLITPPSGKIPLEWPQDLSPRVVDLARIIDRLPEGKHIIEIVKPGVRAQDWHVEISTVQHNRTMTLPKRAPDNHGT